jgi:hypothetical protein
LELFAQAFFHFVLVKINTVFCQPPRENIPIQEHNMYIIHGKESGCKETSWTGSNHGNEVSPESFLSQILFSSKKRLSPS